VLALAACGGDDGDGESLTGDALVCERAVDALLNTDKSSQHWGESDEAAVAERERQERERHAENVRALAESAPQADDDEVHRLAALAGGVSELPDDEGRSYDELLEDLNNRCLDLGY
jgi:hypothetical protein